MLQLGWKTSWAFHNHLIKNEKEEPLHITNWFIWIFYKIQAEFEARKAKEKVSNLDGENEVSFFLKK